jgi:hypothetical protein
MHYSLGTRAHVICTRQLSARLVGYLLGSWAHVMRTRRLHARLNERFGKVFGAHPHPAAIAYNAKAIAQAACQRQATIAATDRLGLLRRQIAIRYTKEWRPKTHASLVRCICHCTENSGTVPCTAKSNENAFNRDARAARSNEPFTTVTNTHTYYTRAHLSRSLTRFLIWNKREAGRQAEPIIISSAYEFG